MEKWAKIVIFLQILGIGQIRNSDQKKMQHIFGFIFVMYTPNDLPEANLRKSAKIVTFLQILGIGQIRNSDQ